VYVASYRCAPCAVKRVPKYKISARALDDMMSEIRMMSRLHHPNIIQFLACCFEPYVCLVLELAANGSLRALLETSKSGFKFKWEEGGASMAMVRESSNEYWRRVCLLTRVSRARTVALAGYRAWPSLPPLNATSHCAPRHQAGECEMT
jgi:hypothetical protein